MRGDFKVYILMVNSTRWTCSNSDSTTGNIGLPWWQWFIWKYTVLPVSLENMRPANPVNAGTCFDTGRARCFSAQNEEGSTKCTQERRFWKRSEAGEPRSKCTSRSLRYVFSARCINPPEGGDVWWDSESQLITSPVLAGLGRVALHSSGQPSRDCANPSDGQHPEAPPWLTR